MDNECSLIVKRNVAGASSQGNGMETRERIVDAARRVILTKGLVRATTKEIAAAASVSEGTLYNHFANKEEMFLSALAQLPSGFIAVVIALPQRAGSDSVRAVLTDLAQIAIDFYADAIPMGASIFADPELLARHRDLLRARGAGPQRANELVAAYLRAEQELGRIRPDADPEAIAYLLLGAVYQRVYWRQFLGQESEPEADGQFVERLMNSLACALFPPATDL
jgi:AcrR family transcriptional regulator